MKTFLMSTPQQAFSKNIVAILASRYQGVNMQTASNNGEMASMLTKDKYDLAIVNSDVDALTLSTVIIAAGLSVPILVYTETSHIPLIKKLYGAGVAGVLNAGDDDKEILKAVADVLAKRIYISENLKQELLRTTTNIANEYPDDIQEVAFPKKPFDFNAINNSPLFTYLGESIPVFTFCLN